MGKYIHRVIAAEVVAVSLFPQGGYILDGAMSGNQERLGEKL